MKKDIETRVMDEANYILENKGTVRSLARVFGVSKSTVHFDLSHRLKRCNYALFLRVKKIIDINLCERHIRGGNATKIKYEKIKNNKVAHNKNSN